MCGGDSAKLRASLCRNEPRGLIRLWFAIRLNLSNSATYRCGSWLGGLVLLIETGGLLLAIDIDHSASRCISSCSRDMISGLCEPVCWRCCWISWRSKGLRAYRYTYVAFPLNCCEWSLSIRAFVRCNRWAAGWPCGQGMARPSVGGWDWKHLCRASPTIVVTSVAYRPVNAAWMAKYKS